MVVQHNLQAMNSNRMLGITQGTVSKASEKLSSGYKINRAADDAAGLSISEKMRKQIRGLSQASINAEDGISAVQTAEGALAEVQDMLQRMNELAVKAANGTNSETDRGYIQNEIDQLSTEIDRVAETTKFNEAYLLKGDSTKDKAVRYEYKRNTSDDVATATLGTGSITFEGGDLTEAEVNTLAKAIRDQGFTISYNSAQSLTSITLNGAAATDFKIVSTGTDGSVEIRNLEGKKVASVTGMTTSGGPQIVTASTVSAFHKNGEKAYFYDASGNVIAENGLDRYVGVADAGQIYDALGKKLVLRNCPKITFNIACLYLQ